MSVMSLFNIDETANNIRKLILEVSYLKQSPHVGSSLSCVEITLSAYMKKLSESKKSKMHTKIVFSKGHASLALYATLSELDLIPSNALENYNENGSHFYGHVSKLASEHVELTTGSLGHGLPYSVGLALADNLSHVSDSEIIVIMSDGECNEGTTWESALIAAQFKLKNLHVIIDRNRLQSLKSTEKTLALEPFADKWRSFGWKVVEVDGHNVIDIYNALVIGDRPLCIIANTSKGKGISFMKDNIAWHYKAPNKVDLERAFKELGVAFEK